MKPCQLYTVSTEVAPPLQAVVLYPEVKRHNESIAFCMTIEEADQIAAVLNASLVEKNDPSSPSSTDKVYSLGYEAGLISYREGDSLDVDYEKSIDPYVMGFVAGWEHSESEYDCVSEPF